MPTYDYMCPKCGKDGISRLVKMSERITQVCECGSLLEQKIGAPQPPQFRGVQATCSMNTRAGD